jgi:hypothetical protein
MTNRHIIGCVVFFAIMAAQLTLAPKSHATLKFYYDPVTGNVSFDTAETRSGGLYVYAFQNNDSASPWLFRPENLIRLSTSQFFTDTASSIGEGNLSTPWQGLYTIGDVLPAGMPENVWKSFSSNIVSDPTNHPGVYEYADVIGGGEPPDADFIYGAPTGEFKNRWDLVDPSTFTWATSAKLIYRPSSGEVVLDTTGDAGGYISAILLQSTGELLPSSFTPFVDSAFKVANPNLISLFANAIEPGRYSIGKILSAGLSRSEFEAAFTSAQFLGLAGFEGASFDFATEGVSMQLQFVPEPASCVLLCGTFLGALGLLRFKRDARTAAMH